MHRGRSRTSGARTAERGPAWPVGGPRRTTSTGRMLAMAEIQVERKKATVWPWVLGLLLLALVAWAAIEMIDVNANDRVETSAAVPAPAVFVALTGPLAA